MIPDIDFSNLNPDELVRVVHDFGFFYLVNHDVDLSILDEARRFFMLPAEEKQALHIDNSAHFRGYSEMKNSRDWREQIHFGQELPAITGADYTRLQGPNLWAASLGASWQAHLLDYMQAIGRVGHTLLAALARGLNLPEDTFEANIDEPDYLLMKLIYYHPQPTQQSRRMGVAPHCDWSLITFLLQDNTGGLQAQTRAGDWLEVTPREGTFAVNLGELVEIITQGYLRATPHRVLNRSAEKSRLSIPVFVNPPLNTLVKPVEMSLKREDTYSEDEHVHRVSQPDKVYEPFCFGESEWQRKGLSKWCYRPECLGD